MNVVAAGVHHLHFGAFVVGRANIARVRQAGLLLHRQRVQIRPHQNRRAAAVAQNADDAVSADPGRDFIPCLFQFIGDTLAGFFFVQGKLRMCVQVFVKFKESRVVLVGARLNGFAQRCWRAIGAWRRQDKRHQTNSD